MKVLKAAAVVAGSMALAGAAAPAFASDLAPMSLNGALDAIASQKTLDAKAVDTNLLDPKRDGGGAVDGATGQVQKGTQAPGNLLGGLPLGE